MNIVVLVKAVPDSEARMTLKPDAGGLVIEEKWELNYFDGLAMEEAVRWKEAVEGTTVTAITYGPKRALEAVRKAAAMGADKVIHVEGPEETLPDSRRTAGLLAAAVRTVPFDLIWCGRKATDDDAAQVGPMVAELLGVPHVGPALAAELSEDRKWVVATRDSEIGQERVRCPLPVLLTAQKGLNEPRVPTIQGVMRGMKLQPTKISPEELALPEVGPSGWKLVGLSEPPRRPPVRILEGSDAASKARELVRILKEEVKVL